MQPPTGQWRWRLAVAASLVLGAAPVAATEPSDIDRSDTQIHTRSAPPAAQGSEEAPAVDVSVVYTFDVWRNARGGLRRSWRYLDNLDVTLTLAAERLAGWRGATIFVYGLYNNGNSLTDELIGDLQTVSNIDAGAQALRLYEAWVEQRFAGGRGSIKLGLYDLNSEFDTNDSNSLFINSSHGIGPDFSQSGQNGPSIFPVTSLALRADYKLSANWLVRAAVLDGVPGDPRRPTRTTVRLGSGDGALLVSELEYSDDRTKAALGYWRYTAKFEDILASQLAGSAVTRGGNDGLYLFAERRLTGGSREAPGLSGWVRFGVADQHLNPVDRYLGGGVVYAGLVPGRDEDLAGIALASVRLGTPLRRAAALAGGSTYERETNIELTYRAALAPWLTVQPDVQYVISPGAEPARKDAVALGLRVEVGF